MVSIIIPTYEEAENISELLERIGTSMDKASLIYEVFIVDDNSQDNSEKICDDLSEKFPVKMIVRKNERGLSTAVICGFKKASGDYLVCMDADLSHPPEKIPVLIEELKNGGEFVLGSRYIKGGSTDASWGIFRAINSAIATLLAKPLTKIKDPMSGFFALSAETFKKADKNLSPVGYKIALELLIKAKVKNEREIPIHFTERVKGKSKLSLKQQILYLQHLCKLYWFKITK